MKSTQASFIILLFWGYLGNVLLWSSYFNTEQAPLEKTELSSEFFSQSNACQEEANTVLDQPAYASYLIR